MNSEMKEAEELVAKVEKEDRAEKKAREDEGMGELQAALAHMKQINFKYSHVFRALLNDNIRLTSELEAFKTSGTRNKKENK